MNGRESTSMTFEEAKNLLRFHSFQQVNFEQDNTELSFLGMLRPYSGLNEEVYHEVMTALKSVADHLDSAECLDREVISALWGICHFGRAYGVDKGGMLRSNNLISDEDVERLDRWVNLISYATTCLLDGTGREVAFEFYDKPPS